MSERLLKITYHGTPAGATKKLNAYLRMPSNTLGTLRREIELYLFQERQLPQTEIRTYWIDSDSDEIEIVNQNDYDIFLCKCEKNMHMQIADAREEKVEAKPESNSAPSSDDPSNFVIHDGVECDGCGTAPMIGFRYKCVQCPNFDLCQTCESAHKHADHLMVRMPTNNGPSVIDAWLSPGGNSHHHRRSRRFRGQCPFAETTTAATAETQAPPATDSHKESRRDRRSTRRQGGLMSHFVDLMMNLPEVSTGGNTASAPSAPTAAATAAAAAATAATAAANAAAAAAAAASTAPTAPAPETKEKQPSSEETTSETTPLLSKTPIVEEPVVTANVEEPVAAPRTKEQAKSEATSAGSSTPTTPVISLENLAQMVNPEYMRAGIEILSNFSEMFAKMIDPNEAAAFGCADTSMASFSSTVPKKSETGTETQPKPKENIESTTSSGATSIDSQSTVSAESVPDAPAPAAPTAPSVPVATTTAETEERRRSDSLDHDWQMIDNSAAPISNVSSTDALINLNTSVNSSTNTDGTLSPARDFVQLGEMLRQHITEEQQREHTTAHTQTSQVDTVSTSTSTNAVATNSTATSTNGVATNTTSTSTTNAPRVARAPEEKRSVPIYHTDERINSAVHAMMAMGFSNEGAWLTQLLESVEGNIPAALDIMHTSQLGRN